MHVLRKEKVSCNGWKRFYNVARQRGASQQVELPPFAEFWQANQLIEMPENPDSERFIRFADFLPRSAGASVKNRQRQD